MHFCNFKVSHKYIQQAPWYNVKIVVMLFPLFHLISQWKRNRATYQPRENVVKTVNEKQRCRTNNNKALLQTVVWINLTNETAASRGSPVFIVWPFKLLRLTVSERAAVRPKTRLPPPFLSMDVYSRLLRMSFTRSFFRQLTVILSAKWTLLLNCFWAHELSRIIRRFIWLWYAHI